MSKVNGNHHIVNEVFAYLTLDILEKENKIKLPKKISKKQWNKVLKIEQHEQGINLLLKIVTFYGVNISEACENLRKRIISEIENLTGHEVSRVDIHVIGINMEESEENE